MVVSPTLEFCLTNEIKDNRNHYMWPVSDRLLPLNLGLEWSVGPSRQAFSRSGTPGKHGGKWTGRKGILPSGILEAQRQEGPKMAACPGLRNEGWNSNQGMIANKTIGMLRLGGQACSDNFLGFHPHYIH